MTRDENYIMSQEQLISVPGSNLSNPYPRHDRFGGSQHFDPNPTVSPKNNIFLKDSGNKNHMARRTSAIRNRSNSSTKN
jgi:hypothetical protein